MERKVIKMGESSLVVSLPKKWTSKSKVSRASLVEVTELSSGELMIRPKIIKEEKRVVTIHSSKNLKENIIYNYVNGADVLEILFDSSFSNASVNEVYETFNKLVGFEITEASHEKVVAVHLGENIPPRKLLNRYSSIMANYFDSLISSFENRKENQFEKIKHVRKLETEKLHYGILRNLLIAASNTKALYEMELDAKDIVYYGLLADNFRDMAGVLEGIEYLGTEYDERLLQIFEELMEIFESAVSAWRRGLKAKKRIGHTSHTAAGGSGLKADMGDREPLLRVMKDLTAVTRKVLDFSQEIEDNRRPGGRRNDISQGILGVRSRSELQLEKIKKDVSISPEEYTRETLGRISSLIEKLKKYAIIISYSV